MGYAHVARLRISQAKEKLGSVCVKCGTDENLEFDHIDRDTKLFPISRGSFIYNATVFWNEVDKCQLLCKPCHKDKTGSEVKLWNVPRHGCGTVSKYQRGCRCDRCRQARRDYDRLRRKNHSPLAQLAVAPHFECGGSWIETRAESKMKEDNLMSSGRKSKIEWDDEWLAYEIQYRSLLDISQELGVSDNAVRKRCKSRGIEIPSVRREKPRLCESRDSMKARLKDMHGTHAGYRLELKLGEGTCEECRRTNVAHYNKYTGLKRKLARASKKC